MYIHPWILEQDMLDPDMVVCAIARQCCLQECDFDATLKTTPGILYYAIEHCTQSAPDSGTQMINVRGKTYVNIWTCFTSSPFFCQYDWHTTPLHATLMQCLHAHANDIQWTTFSRYANAVCFRTLFEDHASLVCWDNVWKHADNIWLQQRHLPTTRSQWKSLSAHPHPSMIRLLEENVAHICWTSVSTSQNPAIVPFLRTHASHLIWHRISCNSNPVVVRMLIDEYYDKIDWYWLSRNSNPDALALLQANPDKINWIGFSWTQTFAHPIQWAIVDAHPDKVSWMGVTSAATKTRDASMDAVHMLTKWAPVYHAQYDWATISANACSEYIPLIRRWALMYVYEFNWDKLSVHPCADILPLWEEYIQHVDWPQLCSGSNPALYSFLSSRIMEDQICWDVLSKNANPSIYPLLVQHVDKLSCWDLCANKNPQILELLQQYPANIDWDILASNVHVVLARHGNDTLL